jgi:transglutaminase-like putative cysteine protease
MMNQSQKPSSETRWGDPVAAIFLFAAILIVAARLLATSWVNELDITFTIAIFGVIAGLALGYSQFSLRLSLSFSLIYGLFIVTWRLGSTLGSNLEWLERLELLYTRLAATTTQVISSTDVTDSILFLIAMALLFWVLGYHAGFTLFRFGDPWAAILPAGAALFIIHINDKLWPFRAWYLGIFLILALMVIARLHFLRLRSDWLKNRTRMPTYVGLDMSRAALLAAAPLILVAWTAPALEKSVSFLDDNVRIMSHRVKDRFDYLFASLQSNVGVVGDFYGETLSLGRGNILGDTLVLVVDAPTFRPAGVRFYWQARNFDYYDETGWSSTIQQTDVIRNSTFDDAVAYADHRWTAEVTVQNQLALRTLHAPQQVLAIDRTGTVEVAHYPDGSTDVAVMIAEPFLRSGEAYTVTSAITNVTTAAMRDAGEDYPAWITDRYLQLPDTITQRTRDLAVRITQGLDTPYDKVAAVTQFLRENIEYSERIEAPPVDQERIDWLLFDYRQGFCNYYASAQVVLLRSLGIPARMVVGYAEGERQLDPILASTPLPGQLQDEQFPGLATERSTFVVRQKDLHAWPEVFFPGIGWVEFEPTASQLPLFRPSGADLPPGQTNPVIEREEALMDFETEEFEAPQGLLPPLPTPPSQGELYLQTGINVGIGLFSLTLLFFAVRGIRRRLPPEPIPVQLESRMRRMGLKPPRFLERWARRAALPILTRAYLEVNRALKRLGKPPLVADTPIERVDQLGRILPTVKKPASFLLDEYLTQTYSARPSDGALKAQQAGRQIRSLSWQAWLKHKLERVLAPLRDVPARSSGD